ncbi:MAG: hypothetical protein ACRDNJ_01100 [Solirubrobacteraceae bacterium]
MPRTSVRRIAFACLLCIAAIATAAVPSAADLAGRYRSGLRRARGLHSQISVQTQRIHGYEGTIAALQGRLAALEHSIAVQEHLLGRVSDHLLAARARLVSLRAAFVRDRATLAVQLRAQYESPPPTLFSVVVEARGFDQLLNGVRDLTTINHANARTVAEVLAARNAVSAQATHLAAVQARLRRATAAVWVERDQIDQVRLSIVNRELAAEHLRTRESSHLDVLRHTLAHEASVLDARAARAQTLSSGGAAVPPSGGCANTPFVAHGGEFGFFPASGTNYQVGEEPIIAARLDQLGRALELHMIGLSGYRTPEHSVEVGGFADDPHTRGEASDTPGVEGVPEATLEEFCLTRPFPGPSEADHIQES